MNKIKVGLVGLGNCASSLIQGVHYYQDKGPADAVDLMHWDIGGYCPFDIEVVAAFDIDVRKVGKDVSEAIFAPPNCTTVFCEDIPLSAVTVRMGRILDGVSVHMARYDEARTFVDNKGQVQPAIVFRVLERSTDASERAPVRRAGPRGGRAGQRPVRRRSA